MDTTASGLGDIATVLGALAKGDLTARITKDYQGTFGELKQYANDTSDALTGMMAQIRERGHHPYRRQRDRRRQRRSVIAYRAAGFQP